MAGLGSLSANGLTCLMMVFGSHRRSAQSDTAKAPEIAQALVLAIFTTNRFATPSSHLGLTRPNALCDLSHDHGLRLRGPRPAGSPSDGDLARGEDTRSVRGWISLRGRVRLLECRQADPSPCQGFRWPARAKRRRALQLFPERPDTHGERLSVRRPLCTGRLTEWADQADVFTGQPRNWPT